MNVRNGLDDLNIAGMSGLDDLNIAGVSSDVSFF